VGDDIFVQASLDEKARRAMSKISIISKQLRDAHLQSLWTSIYYALQPIFHHWLQHNFPAHCRGYAQLLDTEILKATAVCIPTLELTDSLTVRRLRLPARLRGGGIRSMLDLATAAYAGAVCRCLPLLIDSFTSHGEARQGFMPALLPLFGAGSFDAVLLGTSPRFQHFLSMDTPTSLALVDAWTTMQMEAGEPSEGALAANVAEAGYNVHKVQATLTRERERCRHTRLDAAMRSLSCTDIRRAAWLNADRYSSVWVAAWPTSDAWLDDAEFMEVTTRYFGLPSPACRPLLGQQIAGSRTQLDAYGFKLCSLPVPGDGWRSQHDTLKWRLFEDSREMGLRPTAEVYGLFAPLLPQTARHELDSLPARKRQGLVPDLMAECRADSEAPARATLLELKTLHYGSSTYPNSEEQGHAVARRAAAIEREYLGKARHLDRRWLDTAEGHQGPIEVKLRGFGGVRGLVFGAWAEASPDVDWFLSQLAESGSVCHRSALESPSTDDAKAAITWILQRRWGMAAVRANARLLLGRLAYVGRGSAAAAARRDAARHLFASRLRKLATWARRGPRLWRRTVL
jgi:hypothetical protein